MSLFQKDRNLAVPPDRVEVPVRASDFQVEPAGWEVRLDTFLKKHLSWRSRTSIQRLVKDGYVLVRHVPPEHRDESSEPLQEKRPGRVLRHGDEVVVIIPEELRLPPVNTDPDGLVVLFEDDEVLAVDKPPDLAVHPSGKHLSDTVIQRVHARYRSEGAEGERLPIRLCHRLDRETSGLLLLGKGELAHREIMQQFENRRVRKEYLAVVHGEPAEEGGLIDLAIGPALASGVRLKMCARPDGLPSVTEWSVLERRRGVALVRCRPRTGRQHQIRVHLDAIGHPLVGDKLYGVDEGVFLRSARGELTPADRAELCLPRHALHSHRLRWSSPGTGEPRELACPLAGDLRAFLDARPRSPGA